MSEPTCVKCKTGVIETFQRGSNINGTRCMACGYETFAKQCKTVAELRDFIDKIQHFAPVMGEDSQAIVVEAHFTGQIEKAERVVLK